MAERLKAAEGIVKILAAVPAATDASQDQSRGFFDAEAAGVVRRVAPDDEGLRANCPGLSRADHDLAHLIAAAAHLAFPQIRHSLCGVARGDAEGDAAA